MAGGRSGAVRGLAPPVRGDGRRSIRFGPCGLESPRCGSCGLRKTIAAGPLQAPRPLPVGRARASPGAGSRRPAVIGGALAWGRAAGGRGCRCHAGRRRRALGCTLTAAAGWFAPRPALRHADCQRRRPLRGDAAAIQIGTGGGRAAARRRSGSVPAPWRSPGGLTGAHGRTRIGCASELRPSRCHGRSRSDRTPARLDADPRLVLRQDGAVAAW